MTEYIKVGIDSEEWWPVYTIYDPKYLHLCSKTSEIPLDLYIRYKHNWQEFGAIQTEIQKYLEQGE